MDGLHLRSATESWCCCDEQGGAPCSSGLKKIGAYEYLYLVENAREGGRHVQRVIKALGRRDEVEASGTLIDGLIASAARHSRRSIVLSRFYRGELPELRRLSIGPDLECSGRLWAEIGCREVLMTSLLTERHFAFDVERGDLSHSIAPAGWVSGSDRHASGWRQALRIPGADGASISTTPTRRWPGSARLRRGSPQHRRGGRGSALPPSPAAVRHRLDRLLRYHELVVRGRRR